MQRMTDQIGRVLGGRYRLIAPIGTGASAQVYLADDVRLRRRVAVKVLHAALADDASFLRRFRAEAQAAAALSHPHIVAVYDWNDDELPYIVTEYLGGGSLRAMLDAGHLLTTSQALMVGLEASRALEYAHRRGIVHRDVKPANLLFGDDRRLRLADLGLARALAEAAWTEPAGAMLGTARYASPEQARGETVDGRSDVYALALVLIEAVTGKVPFAADTTIATLMARVDKPIEVPEELGPLRKPLQRVGQPLANDRPDAGELSIALLAAAEHLDRPEPLPIVGAIAHETATVPDRDPTVLAGSTLATPGLDATAVDVPAVDGTTTHTSIGSPPAEAPPTVIELDDDAVGRPPRRRRLLVIALTVLLASLLGGGAGYAWVNVRTPAHEVPVLAGKSETEARAAAEKLGWKIDVRADARKDGSKVGDVVSTDPAAGKSLREGKTLVVHVSQGNELRVIPGGLVGKTFAEAQVLLDAAQLSAVNVPKYDETIKAGIVIEVLTKGTSAPSHSAVQLRVSQGPKPRPVPGDLEGLSYDEAAAKISALGLVPKKADGFSDTVKKGKVIGTNPPAGKPVAKGGTVEIIVSKGPDIVTVPNVRGMSLDDAIRALNKAGLVDGDVSGKGSRVGATDPPIGTKVKRGTTVDIFLSRAG
jgi:serine/threonine-protein kinase